MSASRINSYLLNRWISSHVLIDALATADDGDFFWLGTTSWNSTRNDKQGNMTYDGSVESLTGFVTANTTAAAEVNTWTVTIDRSDTTMVLTIPVAVTGAFTVTGFTSFSSGNRIDIRVNTNSAAGSIAFRGWSIGGSIGT